MGSSLQPMARYEENRPDGRRRRAPRDHENRGSRSAPHHGSGPAGVERPMRMSPGVTNAHFPSPSIRTNPAEQNLKEAGLLIVGLRFFICLSIADIQSTLNQYLAANPTKYPTSFPRPVDGQTVYTIYYSFQEHIKRPFTEPMRDYVECKTDLQWKRFAMNTYRDYRPENEADPLPACWGRNEYGVRAEDYTRSKPIDMNEVEEWESSKLCIALRTWIGLRASEIAQILTKYWEVQPDRRPSQWAMLVSQGWIDSHGHITADGVNQSLMNSRLAPYGSLLRYGYENVITQWYWRRRAAVIYSQYPLASYSEPEGRSWMNGEIIGPDPPDPSGENHRAWDRAREAIVRDD